MTNGVFTDYAIEEQYLKTKSDVAYSSMSCVGSSTEELETKIITKNCRGVVAKEVVRGTGNGTLTESLHVPYEIYNKIYDMNRSTLKSGVRAYGRNNVHPEFSITQKVFDEDGVLKYKAYPRCVLETGPNRPVENGAEEVAELELTIKLLPDDYGYCMYEALADEIAPELAGAWLTNFSSELVQDEATTKTVTNVFTNIVGSNTATAALPGGSYATVLSTTNDTALSGATVTVKLGSTTATAGTDYVFNPTTGVLYIPYVSGNIEITASAAVSA